MISANGGLLAHRYTPQVTQRWPRGSEPASAANEVVAKCASSVLCERYWRSCKQDDKA